MVIWLVKVLDDKRRDKSSPVVFDELARRVTDSLLAWFPGTSRSEVMTPALEILHGHLWNGWERKWFRC